MKEHLVLEVNARPTYINKEAAIGMLIAPVFGLIPGAIIGKQRMRHEFEEGKPVYEPSLLNKDALLGGLAGSWAGACAAFFLGISAAILDLSLTTGAVSALATVASGAAIGTYMGAIGGRETMKHEYAQAEQQERAKAQRIAQQLAPTLQPATEHSLTPQMDQSRHFANMIDQQREHTPSQSTTLQ